MSGSIPYWSGTQLLPNTAGSSGQVLVSGGTGAPTWAYGGSPVYFRAGFTANQSNVTGDGTNMNPVIWNTTLVNVGSAYNTGTGYFTCPYTGLYSFSCCIFMTGITSSHTSMAFSCQNNSINEYAWTTYQNPYPIYDVTAGGRFGIVASGTIYCTAGNTVRSVFQVSGGTKVISIYGGTGHQSGFSGHFIGA